MPVLPFHIDHVVMNDLNVFKQFKLNKKNVNKRVESDIPKEYVNISSPKSYNGSGKSPAKENSSQCYQKPQIYDASFQTKRAGVEGLKGSGIRVHQSVTTKPAVPRSQEIRKLMKEPSYCTILQMQKLMTENNNRQFSTSVHPTASIPMLKDHLGEERQVYESPSSVSSSYSELRQAYPPSSSQHHFNQQKFQGPIPANINLYEPIDDSINNGSIVDEAANYFYDPIKQRLFISKQRNDLNSYNSNVLTNNVNTTVANRDVRKSAFFGICSICQGRIVGEGRGCEALGRLYHVSCFVCVHCQTKLMGRPFYALDGKPYCHEGYLSTLERCCECSELILDRILRATGKPYHPSCFVCVVCKTSLDGVPFTVDAYNRVHCIEDFHRRFAPKCWVCKGPIMPQKGEEEAVRVVALDRSFHLHCYTCECCGLVLNSSSSCNTTAVSSVTKENEEEDRSCYPLDGHVLCKSCNTRKIQQLTADI